MTSARLPAYDPHQGQPLAGVIACQGMADPAEPLILGYDSENKRWSAGDVTARVRSLSEPDRAVPLSARLEVVPDILDYTLDCSQTELFRASLRLRPEAQLPADDRARLTIIADPMLEAGLQVLAAAGGLPVPPPFKNLRAQVQVVLVPYCLCFRVAEEEIGSPLALEGDARTPVVLEVGVYRVDGAGRLSAQPMALSIETSGTAEGVKIESLPRPEGGLRLRLLMEKPLLGAARTAGSLSFSATLPGGRVLQRSLSLQLKPLTVELQLSPPGPYRLGDAHPPQLLLAVKNSLGKPVSGLSTRWQLQPAVGSLSALEAVTDASGQIRLSYRPPTPEAAEKAFQDETLALQVQVAAGAEPLATAELLLKYVAVVNVTVQKAGFATLSRRLELHRPGGVRLQLRTAAGKKDPVAYASVSINGKSTPADNPGQTVLELELELDTQSQDLCKLIAKELAQLQQADWITGMLTSACQRVETFVANDYVSRLAAEKPEEYADSFLNLKALHPLVHVGQLSVQLFERRYGHFREQLSAAMGNLAGAFYTWMGEKYFPKIGTWLGDKVSKLLRYLAGKISGKAWVLARARGAVTTLRGWLGRLSEKLESLRHKVGPQRRKLPESLDQKLNHSFAIPPPLGHVAAGEEALQLVEEAARKAVDARKLQAEAGQALKLLEQEAADLQARLARAEAAATPNPSELSQLRQQLQTASQRLERAGNSARQAQQALQQAEQAEQTARTSLADLQEMCTALNELLTTFMQALSKIYEYGAWLLAYLIVQIGAALLTNMRTVLRGVHPGAPASLDAAVDDLVSKQAFTTAFELGGYYLVGPAIHQGLLLYQSYSLSVALEEALDVTGRWQKRDPEEMKAAIRWWYEEIDAASFKTEETEVWVELGAELVDWLEWLLVWITRLVNLVLGVVGAVVSLLTLGATLPAWLLVSAGFTALMEGMDRFWDIIKAVARSGGALMGATEVWGVVLPAHGSFTAKLYGDPGLQQRLDRAWTYPIDAELRQKLAGLASGKTTFPGETALETINTKLEELGS